MNCKLKTWSNDEKKKKCITPAGHRTQDFNTWIFKPFSVISHRQEGNEQISYLEVNAALATCLPRNNYNPCTFQHKVVGISF
jgi:hypothetical protein